jgi:hypothetical protein
VLTIIGLLAVAGGLLWLISVPARRPPDPDARDRDVLEQAETEVRDLNAQARPEDADDALSDWGPGAPGA